MQLIEFLQQLNHAEPEIGKRVYYIPVGGQEIS